MKDISNTQPPQANEAAEQDEKARSAAALAQILNNLWEQNPFNANREEDKRR